MLDEGVKEFKYSSCQVLLKVRIAEGQDISSSDFLDYVKYRLNLKFGSHGLIILDEIFILSGSLKK